MGKITDIAKWRVEIEAAEKFREDEFGILSKEKKFKAGCNIDYFEQGFSDGLSDKTNVSIGMDVVTTVNLVDAIVSVIVPSLYFKNPKSVVTPSKMSSETTAPLVAKILDHYRKKMQAEDINKMAIWDAYVVGYGVTKLGYTTKFGMNIRDEGKEKEKKKSFTDRINAGLEAVGLKKKKEEEIVRPEMDLRITAESPFLSYVNPFDFGIDPRASSINDASFVYHKVKKTVKSLKENKKYKNTNSLKGTESDIKTLSFQNVSESEMDDFKIVDLYEIHYRNEDDFYLLVISCDGSEEWREHYHDESVYDLGDWQFDILTFKKHGHALYPRSDITKLIPLQSRITETIDSILEQVDKFVPKLAYKTGGLTPTGKKSLEQGGIGALVETSENPDSVFKELNFTQLKGDLQALVDQIISLVSIQTGLTRAQLTGLSDTDTATEATIAQGGQSIRLSDMSSRVQSFVNRQSEKLWKVIKQFVELEELELINGVKGRDPQTGLPVYDWLTIPEGIAEKLMEGEYDFDIEVGSTQKIDLSVMRKSFENMFNILARTEVLALMQAQGDNVNLAEVFKGYVGLFPEIGIDASKIIQKIDPAQRNLPLQGENRGGQTSGSNANELRSQQAERVPSAPQTLQEAAQI